MRPVVNAMVMVVVMPMMRRVRQRHVCEQNQCDREPNNLTHDSIPNLSSVNARGRMPVRIG
jgi:hypothetical protein